MDAAIQEAVQGVPYFTDENETIDFSHTFDGWSDVDETYEYTINASIPMRAMKEFIFNISVTYRGINTDYGTIYIKFKLPSGGTYAVISPEKYDIYSGSESIGRISMAKTGSMIGGTYTKNLSYTCRIARLS